MTTTKAPPLQLLEIDPRRLQVNPANVRKKTKGLDELAASIAKIGVQVPLIVRTNGTGDTYVIVAGERRALAAVQAEVASVPVIVRSYDDDGQAELTAMMVENLHRENLTAADEAKGFEQLAAFGISVDEIAQLTGRDKGRVTTGLAVAKSDTSSAITAKYDLTLEQAAVIAEFDGDNNTVKELTFASQKAPEQFDHIAERARQERERVAARAAKTAELQSAGVKILAASKRFGYDPSAKNGCVLTYLLDAKGKAITPASHKKCAGHAAEVDHWGRNVTFGCTDPKTHGHKAKHGGSSTTSRSNAPARKTAADKEKEAAAKLQAELDAKALEASTVVRRKFVKDLLGRKTPPKGLLGFVVPVIVEYEIWGGSPKIVEELTGAKPGKGTGGATATMASSSFSSLTAGASDARLQLVLLAWVACTLEDDWSSHLLAPRPYQSNVAEAKYLQYLASCGYGLSEIEQRIVAAAFPPAKAARAKKAKVT